MLLKGMTASGVADQWEAVTGYPSVGFLGGHTRGPYKRVPRVTPPRLLRFRE